MNWNDIVILVFSGLVAASTVIYAFLTWRLVSETRELRQAQTEPRISIRAEFSDRAAHGALELVIRNEGQGAARDIKFRFQGDPNHFVETGISVPVDQIPVIRDGLPYLGPNQRFDMIMGWLRAESFRHASKNPWTFYITYENHLGKPNQEVYVVDFSQFDALIMRDSSPLFKMEEHLGQLQKTIERLVNGNRQIGVITQTKEEFLEKQNQRMAERAATRDITQNVPTETEQDEPD